MNEENGKKQCFVIAPIGEPESETRKRSDQILKHVIRPAMSECGYDAIRADEIDRPGIITSQVIQRVVGDPLVIADLTEMNPNVFYELAIRHAIRKPLVQLIKKGERIPFDVAGTRTIQVDHHDLDSVEAAKIEIIAQVRALELDQSEIETPISVSLDLQLLRQSDNPEERSLADVLGIVSEIRNSLQKIELRLGDVPSLGIGDEIAGAFKEILPQLEHDLALATGKRRKRIDPFILREVIRPGKKRSSDPINILIIFSFFKDDLPWIYELGMEFYRSIIAGNHRIARDILMRIKDTIDLTLHDQFLLDDIGFSRKDLYMIIEDLPMILNHFINDSLLVE